MVNVSHESQLSGIQSPASRRSNFLIGGLSSDVFERRMSVILNKLLSKSSL